MVNMSSFIKTEMKTVTHTLDQIIQAPLIVFLEKRRSSGEKRQVPAVELHGL